MVLPSVKDAEITKRRILVRLDWNVPLDSRGTVVDDFKIRASVPTLQWLRRQAPDHLFLLSHLGNPVVRSGESFTRTQAGNRTLTFAAVARYVRELLKLSAGEGSDQLTDHRPVPGYQLAPDLTLLENLRFHPGELANDRQFASQLASLGTLLVHEAFPEIHREVASLVALPQRLPTVAGLRLIEEINHLDQVIDKRIKPTIMILGGAKVADKILVIDALLKHVDHFLLGGVMANTFLAATGVDLKASVIDEERCVIAKQLFNRAPQKFLLPIDFVWDRDKALDIGPQTQALFARYIAKAALAFWNGPLGWTASGKERFFHGSEAIARALAAMNGTSIAAGGDTLAVIDRYQLTNDLSLLSTGGGAALAYLAGEELPGLKVFKPK
ncbi:phosphoglycerate kinase [Candidatus Berkelbacteria bacterium]|nr:phosphoglycerate kinase [Candidatus Berkelbacteria bacterium]